MLSSPVFSGKLKQQSLIKVGWIEIREALGFALFQCPIRSAYKLQAQPTPPFQEGELEIRKAARSPRR